MMICLAFVIFICTAFSTNGQLVELVDFSHSQCDEIVSDYIIRVRIISKKIESDTFKLSIGFAVSCCMEFNGKAEMKNDTLHVSLERKTEEYCFCTCCYNSEFELIGIKNIDIPIKFHDRVIQYSAEKYETFPPSFNIIKRDTVNYTDKYGLKQGKWWDTKNRYKVYFKNRLVGWGKISPNGDVEEYNLRTKMVTVTNKKGKILKQFKQL